MLAPDMSGKERDSWRGRGIKIAQLQTNHLIRTVVEAATEGLGLRRFNGTNGEAMRWFTRLCDGCECDRSWREREENPCMVLSTAGVTGEDPDWFITSDGKPWCRWFCDGTRPPPTPKKEKPDWSALARELPF